MPRKRPTTNINVLGCLDGLPEKVVGEYLTSKEKANIFKKPPTFDTAGDDVEACYIWNKFVNETYLGQLEELRKHKKLQECIYEQRIRKLHQTHNKLHTRFTKVNNFIRVSDEKRKVAVKKINAEIEKQRELAEAIEKKQEAVEELKQFRVELKSTCDEYKLYETVLDDAVKESTFFPSVKELINRCDAIMMAQGEIILMDAVKFQKIEAMHKRIKTITKQAELVYLGMMNELARMERSYQHAQEECLRWEKIQVSIKDAIIATNFKKERVRDAMSLLYRIMCNRAGIEPVLFRKDVEKEADFIKDEVEFLRDLIKECSIRLGTQSIGV